MNSLDSMCTLSLERVTGTLGDACLFPFKTKGTKCHVLKNNRIFARCGGEAGGAHPGLRIEFYDSLGYRRTLV